MTTPNAADPRLRMPDFCIIGAQKSGTTSLHACLAQHPNVSPASRKELHFFDLNYHRGPIWYSRHFDDDRGEEGQPGSGNALQLQFEATPYYLLHPHAPARCHALLPALRMIVLLRDPVDRAFSHYRHEVRKRREHLSFEEALRHEERRLDGELEHMLQDERYQSIPHRHCSYLARGVYIDQILRWTALYARDQFLFVCSEDFFCNPSREYRRVLRFLGLPQWEPKHYMRLNTGDAQTMNARTRDDLSVYFAPHNARLSAYLGRVLPWCG